MALISCFEILRCSEIDAVSCSKLLENVDLVSFVKANTERCFQVGEYVSRLWALNKFYFLLHAGTMLISKNVSRIRETHISES